MFQPVQAVTTNKHRESLLPVLIHCEEHLDEPLKLTDLAAIAGFSPYHFHRVFQNVTGEAPKEYLRRLRLERAVHRLKVSPDNLLHVALEAGYATHETFTRAFTRTFGIKPSGFRAVLREYRECVDETMGNCTVAGFTDETPLTLRFDLNKEPVTVERTPPRHLIFTRHKGYENLLHGRDSFLGLWDELFAYADEHDLGCNPELLIGITHDDPYVTEERHIRFDACLPVSGPVQVKYPVGYRYQPPGLCVSRRHFGGLEEIAKTYAYIGVDWLLTGDYGLSAAAPFETYHCKQADGRLERVYTDAYVPLESVKANKEEK